MSSQESQESALADLDDVIRGFLSRNNYLHEFRLQKLIYLAELLAVQKEGSRLTDAEYKPYMYGAYSEDLADKLSDMEPDVSTKATTHHGKLVTAFVDPDKSPELDDTVEAIIDKVHEKIKDTRISNDEFGEWSKESWLYQNTPFDHKMNFLRYQDEASDRLDQDLAQFNLEQEVED